MSLTFGSVCSGIEAASVAWAPLGWHAAFFSEIEKFPSAVLAHHYGSNMPGEALTGNGVANYGDMTRFEDWPDHGENSDRPIDLLVGGTPCQDYSIAGLRLGMAGQRGQLTLTYIEIAARYRPRWLVWENVPGVLSSQDGRDFARILGDISGQVVEVPPGGWKNAGIVAGIDDAYGLAWHVLDAQFVRVDGFERAVPQRRRRLFVVGYLGDWRRAAAVLLEPESLRGDPAPRRDPAQGTAAATGARAENGSETHLEYATAPTLSARTKGGGGLGTDFDLDGGLIANSGDVEYCLTASAQNSLDAETETLVAHALRGEGFDASEDGTGRGTPLVPVAFSGCDDGGDAQFGKTPTLCVGSGKRSGGGQQLAVAIQERAVSENPKNGPQGEGFQSDLAYTLEARNKVRAVAYDMRGREGGSQFEGPHDTANIRAANGGSSKSYIADTWAVRRLTPIECHRLQGFTDGYCDIPWRGKPNAPDGPQYKALGNSMAINVMRWIGQRIAEVDAL